MSHMLEKLEDGSYSIAYAGDEKPWHNLGKNVSKFLKPREMQKEAGLLWGTKLIPTYYSYNGKTNPTGDSALVRDTDGRLLTVVSDDWKPVQNDDAADFFNEYVDAAGATMETAGSIDDGRKVWFLAKLKQDQFALFKGKDVVEPYLLFTSPNLYGMSTSVSLTAIRVVCDNTLTLSLSGTKGDKIVRVSHRKDFDAEDVKKTLGLVHKKMGQYKEAMTFLSTKKASPEKISEYLKQVFPIITAKPDGSKREMSKMAKIAHAALDQQPGVEFGQGTWYQPYQAVTFVTDHLAARTDSARLDSAWYGLGRKTKTRGLELAMEYADKA